MLDLFPPEEAECNAYARRDFMVPMPHFNSWDELNAHLEAECRKHRQQRLCGHSETIGERFELDLAAMLPLPVSPSSIRCITWH